MNTPKTTAILICASMMAIGAFANTVTLSFQEGDLRGNGVLLDAAYQTHATTIRGGAFTNTVFQQATAMYIGDHAWDGPMRGLFAFDLSKIEELSTTGGGAYTISNATVTLTTAVGRTNFPGDSTFRAYRTDAFDEATATYANPGPGHAQGGTEGLLITSYIVTADFARNQNKELVISSTGWMKAVTNALGTVGLDDTLNFMLRRATENGASNYFFRAACDEYSGSLGVDVRPELVVDVVFENDVSFDTAPATILDVALYSSNVLRLVVDAPDAAAFYAPLGTLDLEGGSWTNVAHSTNGAPASFIYTNLAYSTPDASGTNEVIYVEAGDIAGFFGIGDAP